MFSIIFFVINLISYHNAKIIKKKKKTATFKAKNTINSTNLLTLLTPENREDKNKIREGEFSTRQGISGSPRREAENMKKNPQRVEDKFSKVEQLFIGETICKERKEGGRTPYNRYSLKHWQLVPGGRSVRRFGRKAKKCLFTPKYFEVRKLVRTFVSYLPKQKQP